MLNHVTPLFIRKKSALMDNIHKGKNNTKRTKLKGYKMKREEKHNELVPSKGNLNTPIYKCVMCINKK